MVDKEAIVRDYLNGKSLSAISKELGINVGIVHRVVKKSGVKMRSLSESVNLTLKEKDEIVLLPESVEIIKGNLLGDGNLRIPKKGKRANYFHIDKHLEYIKWLKGKLEESGITFGEIYKTSNGCYAIQSHSASALNGLYHLFYKDGSRIVPVNLKLTPTVVRQWYISDGHIRQGGGIFIAKVTDNPDAVIEQFKKDVGIEMTYHKSGKFYIKKRDVKEFLRYIGDCPVDCYKYKWEEDVQRL